MVHLDERSAVRRLFDRLGFGPRPGELDAAASRGFAATVDTLLSPAGSDAGAGATPLPRLPAEPARPGKDPAARKQLLASEATLLTWWLDRLAAADQPLRERLTWFWHGHFATSEQKVRSPRLMLRQNETFRALGLAGFGALAHALVVDPAMLIWLDGGQNKAGSPNENLAREFMELFALGIGHYTETDVREAARALTGWTVNRASGTARLVPRRQDHGVKTVLGATGDLDATSYVDAVLARPDSPRFVVSRLWFRLVSAAPPPPDVVDRLAAAYGPERDVTAVLRAITKEPAFTDSATTLVKQPVEWLTGLLRALGLRASALPAAQLIAGLRAMGQVPFLPPNVGGWPSGTAWLTTGAALARLRVAELVAQHADLSGLGDPAAVAARLGITFGPRTTAAFGPVAHDPRQLLAVAACAPEYVVST
ncbi:DUF1800 domain-containing protein [Amycolatopsis alkalitolerans]|uniref:DUF1800 domain-containing protein n=1 Tax=Amycolatopsis alkalitolerans TaxID=2547244 RepID=A0A5C4LPW3_9PSEU|nr:DUF1800 domain-containing protein [Amycolatopsis alkalitolerans]TNC19958.1 DUF1800 domain-containing protein [Amycolatopsis alkalitolerans]